MAPGSATTRREKWMLGFAVLSLLFCAFGFWLIAHPSVPPNYMASWGNTKPNGVLEGFMIVDTAQLQNKADDFRLAAVELHWDGVKDINDNDDLQKSAAFDITPGSAAITIPLSNAFTRVNKMQFFYLLLLPKSVEPSQFDTIHEAQALGVQVLATASAGAAAPGH